jgi:hypothetical protein
MCDFFISKYKGLFTLWLRGAKSRAEKFFDEGVERMKSTKWPSNEAEINQQLNELFERACKFLNSQVCVCVSVCVCMCLYTYHTYVYIHIRIVE